MLGAMLGLALMSAAQDVPPLAGSLPPMPAPRTRPNGSDGRPRGRLFISPMGEPFRGPDPVRAWFDGADANHDGALTLTEFVADAGRFFVALDRGKDGEIDPEDIDYYETVLAPEIRTAGSGGEGGAARGGGMRGGQGGGRRGGGGGGGRRGGGGGGGGYGGGGGSGAASGGETQRYADVRRGAARFGFFDYPEPVTVADTNLNRGVDPKEFRDAATDRFAVLDKNHDGKITFDELPRLPDAPAGGFGGRGKPGGSWRGASGGTKPPEGDPGE
jgi:hypothetical protein